MSKLVGFVGIVLLVTFAAFAFVPMIDDADGTTTSTFSLTPGNTTDVTDRILVGVNSASADDVTVTVTDSGSGERVSQTIMEGNTEPFAFDDANATVDVTANSTTSDTSILTVEHPRTFGASAATIWVSDNLGLLLVVVTFVGIMAAFQVVING